MWVPGTIWMAWLLACSIVSPVSPEVQPARVTAVPMTIPIMKVIFNFMKPWISDGASACQECAGAPRAPLGVVVRSRDRGASLRLAIADGLVDLWREGLAEGRSHDRPGAGPHLPHRIRGAHRQARRRR